MSFNYTSRTFTTIYNDINSDDELRDKPDWFKRMISGTLDVLSMALNAQGNDTYLETSFTDRNTDRLLQLIDYQRSAQTTSSGIVLFDILRTATFPFSVSQADLVAYSQGSVSVSSKRFEATSGATFTAVSESFTRSGDTLVVARVYTTGELFRVTGGSLPTPLVIDTDYYAIYDTDTSIKVAASRTDAYNGTFITLTGAGSGTINLFSKQITMYQRTSVAQQTIGTSDGTTEWQEYDLPDLNILTDTVEIEVNSLSWTAVDTFVYSESTDRHFKVLTKTDGSTAIQFGNGTYGDIPPAFDILVEYATGGGTDSNISTVNKVNTYGGADSNITGVSNPSTLSGGDNKESVASAKVLAPILLKTRDRFITIEDGEALALAYGGVEQVKINKNVYGLLSCQVVIVPTGGGTPSSALKTALQSYLIDRTVLESIDVRVEDPTYVSTAFTSAFRPTSGFLFADVKPFYDLGVLMLIDEKSQEIKNSYIDSGIDQARTDINTYWSGTLSYTFSSTENDRVEHIITESTAPDFGLSIQESNTIAFLDSIEGVDYLTISVPASFPVTFADDEISTAGTITTTEIT